MKPASSLREPLCSASASLRTRRSLTAVVILLGPLLGGCDNGGTETSDPTPTPLTSEATITIDIAASFQEISGWEATAQAAHEHPAFPLVQNELFDRAVNELGINRLRLEVRSGAETRTDWYSLLRSGQIDEATWRNKRYATVNDNDDPFKLDQSGFRFSELDTVVLNVVLPLKQRLEARGESLFINVTYVAFNQITDGGAYHHDDSPEEYAEFVLAVHQHLQQAHGLRPDAWEVILEPDNTDFWRGRQIGEAIVAAAELLQANGFDTPFIAPSNTNMSRAIDYFDDAIDVPGVTDHLAELSYHRYGGVSDGNLLAIGDRGSQHGIGTSMLEHIGSGHEDLHKDLTIAGVSAWQQFALAFQGTRPLGDKGGVYYTVDVTDPANPEIVIGSRTRFLSQYFRYVRRGARRIAAASKDEAFDPVAFVNREGGHVVVIKASSAGELSVEGLPAGTYGVSYTTQNEFGTEGPEATIGNGGILEGLTIPGQGVLTVYRK